MIGAQTQWFPGGKTLANRFVLAPIKTALNEPGGRTTEAAMRFYRSIAEGGTALLILEPAAVASSGIEHPKQLCLFRDEHISGIRSLVDSVHDQGARAATHLNHAGRAANPKVIGHPRDRRRRRAAQRRNGLRARDRGGRRDMSEDPFTVRAAERSRRQAGRLWIEAAMGMAGDMFVAALLGLGAPEEGVLAAMRTAAELVGGPKVRVSRRKMSHRAGAWQIILEAGPRAPLPIVEAPERLERALQSAGVRGPYAGLAHRAVAILCAAERTAHGVLPLSSTRHRGVELRIVGTAHTAYRERAPYQPPSDTALDGEDFFIEIEADLVPALDGLESFSHLLVLSHLERSPGYSLRLRPPWKDGQEQYGVFATRSPNRPSPVGLSRVRLRRIDGARLITGPIDLFDGTPIVDIKPFIQSLDGNPAEPGASRVAIAIRKGDPLGEMAATREAGATQEAGAIREGANDGWLTGSDHLELHRSGMAHSHPGGGQLHEAQDIVVDVVGAAWALQHLVVDLNSVACVAPVRVGGGLTRPSSHGQLTVPAPATRIILDRYGIAHDAGPVEAELLTPTGAAILAALSPTFLPELPPAVENSETGAGMGRREFSAEWPNVLRLFHERGF